MIKNSFFLDVDISKDHVTAPYRDSLRGDEIGRTIFDCLSQKSADRRSLPAMSLFLFI